MYVMSRSGIHIHVTSNGNHVISSTYATEIVMMKAVHFLGQYLNSKWLSGGHVEILVMATPPD